MGLPRSPAASHADVTSPGAFGPGSLRMARVRCRHGARSGTRPALLHGHAGRVAPRHVADSSSPARAGPRGSRRRCAEPAGSTAGSSRGSSGQHPDVMSVSVMVGLTRFDRPPPSGARLARTSDHGEHGEEAPAPPPVHPGVRPARQRVPGPRYHRDRLAGPPRDLNRRQQPCWPDPSPGPGQQCFYAAGCCLAHECSAAAVSRRRSPSSRLTSAPW
jgi:hypothetical protein